jgi:hypothetical protein
MARLQSGIVSLLAQVAKPGRLRAELALKDIGEMVSYSLRERHHGNG